MRRVLLLTLMCSLSAVADESALEGVMGIESISVKQSFADRRNEILNKKEFSPNSMPPTESGKEKKTAVKSEEVEKPNREKIRGILNSFKGSSRTKSQRDAVKATNRKISVESGENIVLYVSKGSPNRIRTPFSEPIVMANCDQSEMNRECIISVSDEGGVVNFQTIVDRPIGTFITPKEQPEISINLFVQALDSVPPQDVYIDVKDYKPTKRTKKMDELAEKSEKLRLDEYSEWMNDLTISLVNGDIPEGFSEQRVDGHMKCRLTNIETTPGYILNGGKNRVDIYTIANKGMNKVQVNEPECYKKGVRFVFSYPNPVLYPGQTGELFVVRRKIEKETNKRRRLVR